MAFQSLKEFQETFRDDPVLVEFDKDVAFYLKPLTSAAKDEFEASVVGTEGKRDLHNLRARLVAKCLCDESGELLGTAQELGGLRADVVGFMFDKVRELNGMDAEDVEEAGKG